MGISQKICSLVAQARATVGGRAYLDLVFVVIAISTSLQLGRRRQLRQLVQRQRLRTSGRDE